MRYALTVVLVALVPSSLALAQPSSGATTRIPTFTRLVKQFFELETTLDEKLSSGDSTALDGLIDTDFEVRNAADPGAPVPRGDWLRISTGQANKPRIEQMAVHDFGNVVIVSFKQSTRPKGIKQDRVRMIVDAWKRSGDRWMLAVRYDSSPTAGAATVDRKPTGRD